MASNPCSSSSSPEREPRHLVYDLGWATSVVRRALRSHARAWEILLTATGLSEHHLALLLATADPDWPRIREISHVLDRWIAQQEKVGRVLSVQEWVDGIYLTLVTQFRRINSSESLISYLTRRVSAHRIKEQGFEGEVGAQAKASPRLLADGGGLQLDLDLCYLGRCSPGACESCSDSPQCKFIRD